MDSSPTEDPIGIKYSTNLTSTIFSQRTEIYSIRQATLTFQYILHSFILSTSLWMLGKLIKMMVPLNVRTHFHLCLSIASPESPSKKPSGPTSVFKFEDWRKSVSGPEHKRLKWMQGRKSASHEMSRIHANRAREQN